MVHVPSGKPEETEFPWRHTGLDKTREFVLRFRRSDIGDSRESCLSSAWISPDRSFENTRHSQTMGKTGRLKGTGPSDPVAAAMAMRQNGGDEAGSGLLLRANGGRKTGSISA